MQAVDEIFSNKTLLISGGTGSFGNAVTKRFINSELKEIRVFSRDEKKQDDMRKHYNTDKLKFYLGDVRDYRSILSAVDGVDYIFHAAALKQVPSCDFHPMQAVKTNIIGTENIIEAAKLCRVKKIICLSTDKAVYPINAMGMSKALMEKVAISKSRSSSSTVICVTRYGNVIASRGSVIPRFIEQIQKKIPLTITDPNMTRFMMSLDDAVNLVLFAFLNGKQGETFVQKSPAATIETLAQSIKFLMGVPDHETKIIGTRHGEKLFEVLLSREEFSACDDLINYYKIPPDLRDLNYEKFTDIGETKISNMEEYSSHNTKRLSFLELNNLISDLGILNYMD